MVFEEPEYALLQLGSVAHAALHRSGCPVAVVPRDA
jgi:nucleotide-binding universal stress UspA family protein